MRKIDIKKRKDTDVTDEALYALNNEAYMMWSEQGMEAPWLHRSLAEFQRIIHSVTMFVALDAETGELLGMHSFRSYRRQGWCYGFLLAVASSARCEGIASQMFTYETEYFRRSGFSYIKEVTATTADWSIRWHLKNGFRIGCYALRHEVDVACHITRHDFADADVGRIIHQGHEGHKRSICRQARSAL